MTTKDTRVNPEKFTMVNYDFKFGIVDDFEDDFLQDEFGPYVKDITYTRTMFSKVVKDDPEWEIDSELKDEVLRDMPDDLSPEEKALYIYLYLCKSFKGDEQFFFRKKLDNNIYCKHFDKERLEKTKPKSKVTCSILSRVYPKLVNDLDAGITAVPIVIDSDDKHYCIGLYSDKISAILEPINMDSTTKTNDLTNVKAGIKVSGIEEKSDFYDVIPKALERVYPLIYEKEPLDYLEFIKQLKEKRKGESLDELEENLSSLMKEMKEKDITGNEFSQILSLLLHNGYFPEEIDCVFLGKKYKEDGETRIKRSIALFKKNEDGKLKGKDDVYLINSEDMRMRKYLGENIKFFLDKNALFYEKDNRTIDFDLEQSYDDVEIE